jgi:hypothetical protein
VSGNLLLKIFVLALIGSFTSVSPTLSEERKCILRDGYPIILDLNQHFAGMFRIPLNPPDFHNPMAVQRHLVLSLTWIEIIDGEMYRKIGGLCHALVVPNGFPDLRVSMKVYRTGSQIDREKSVCAHVLEDILQHFQPNDELIKRAAKRNAFFMQPPPPSGERPEMGDARNIMEAALPFFLRKRFAVAHFDCHRLDGIWSS